LAGHGSGGIFVSLSQCCAMNGQEKSAMRIAIVDDEQEMRSYLSELLTQRRYKCLSFVGGREVVSAFARDTFDMLIVDWNMPGMNGVEVIRWVRKNIESPIPIIMLTSRSDERDIVEGLEAGADDFIVKPEKANVIAARVAALARRSTVQPAPERQRQFGRYTFDTAGSIASLDGVEIALTSKEFALALVFFQNMYRPLSRTYLLETVWNSVADLPTRTLDVHVSRIRSKLQLARENGYRIQTIFGFGYRFESYDDD
jgi:DNA-binding response OmpR family regulator